MIKVADRIGVMMYRGHVEHGVVVLDGAASLPEGEAVSVRPVRARRHGGSPGSAHAILKHAGVWADASDEVDRTLRELMQMKQDEVRSNRPDAVL